MSYVSPLVENNFKQREREVADLIRSSGIDYVKFGIFGSYARKEYTASSDIDFCIIVNSKPNRCHSGALRESAELLGTDITIVSLDYFNNDDSNFAKQLRRDFIEVG